MMFYYTFVYQIYVSGLVFPISSLGNAFKAVCISYTLLIICLCCVPYVRAASRPYIFFLLLLSFIRKFGEIALLYVNMFLLATEDLVIAVTIHA